MIPYMRANLAAETARPRGGRRHHRGKLDDRRGSARAVAGDRRRADRDHSQSRRRRSVAPDGGGERRAALAEPYALYLGKLAPNKGTTAAGLHHRAGGARLAGGRRGRRPRARARSPRDAARSDRDIRMIGWVDQQTAAAWMAHASMLVFPSRGPESLSRVLIEASALGVPIAAMKPAARPTSSSTSGPDCFLRRRRSLPPTSGGSALTRILEPVSARRRRFTRPRTSMPRPWSNESSVSTSICSRAVDDRHPPRRGGRTLSVPAARFRRARTQRVRSGRGTWPAPACPLP